MPQPLVLTAFFSAALCILFLISGILSAKKHRYMGSIASLLLSLLMLSLALFFAVTTTAIQGYRALTYEETCSGGKNRAAGKIKNLLPTYDFCDGRIETYELAGDELYVDAHILKWKPIVNVLGLHTVYELDRIAGRYRSIEDEKWKLRTVHRLSKDKPVNMFDLRRRYTFLKPILDAEYGSATFVNAHEGGEFEIRVSSSGLLAAEFGKVTVFLVYFVYLVFLVYLAPVK